MVLRRQHPSRFLHAGLSSWGEFLNCSFSAMRVDHDLEPLSLKYGPGEAQRKHSDPGRISLCSVSQALMTLFYK